ncbi:hypothetical protein EDB86DRAFT_2030705 [Lactarius hatsudake]|nr:hypothetical protein EDB86DRAFT_2030705 [Lactarius hatsudake]
MLTVGRTSIFSAMQTRTIVIILLADLLPGVKADCWIDSDGFEHCNTSLASRLGIAVASTGHSLFSSVCITQQTSALSYLYQRTGLVLGHLRTAPPARCTGQTCQRPAEPAEWRIVSLAASPTTAYDPNAGFAPPAGSPPQYYPPPPGAPSVEYHKGLYHV